ncbi:MAG: hypothetical protein ACFFBD_10985 [Candidatus Hodarchaeota archaeon]
MSEEEPDQTIVKPSIRQLAFPLIIRMVLLIVFSTIGGYLFFSSLSYTDPLQSLIWFLSGIGLIVFGITYLILPFRLKILLAENEITFVTRLGHTETYKRNEIRSVTPVEQEGSLLYRQCIRLILLDTKTRDLMRYYLLIYSKSDAEKIIEHIRQLI